MVMMNGDMRRKESEKQLSVMSDMHIIFVDQLGEGRTNVIFSFFGEVCTSSFSGATWFHHHQIKTKSA